MIAVTLLYMYCYTICTLPHVSEGVLLYHLLSVSHFHFFKLSEALILGRSGLGLLHIHILVFKYCKKLTFNKLLIM